MFKSPLHASGSLRGMKMTPVSLTFRCCIATHLSHETQPIAHLFFFDFGTNWFRRLCNMSPSLAWPATATVSASLPSPGPRGGCGSRHWQRHREWGHHPSHDVSQPCLPCKECEGNRERGAGAEAGVCVRGCKTREFKVARTEVCWVRVLRNGRCLQSDLSKVSGMMVEGLSQHALDVDVLGA